MKDYLKYDWPRHKKIMREAYLESDENIFLTAFACGSIFVLLIFALSIFGPSQ